MKKSFAKYAVMSLVLSALLTGCTTGRSNFSDEELQKINLPIVRKYEQRMLYKAAGELARGATPYTAILVKDYGVMRDEVRVLQGEEVDVDR